MHPKYRRYWAHSPILEFGLQQAATQHKPPSVFVRNLMIKNAFHFLCTVPSPNLPTNGLW